MNSRSAIARLLEDEEKSVSGALVSKAYARWRDGGDLKGASKDDFVKALQEPDRMAVVVGQLVAQANNGGIYQWIDNGYADAGVEWLIHYCETYVDNYPVFGQLQDLLNEIDEIMADAPGDTMMRRLNALPSEEDLESAIYEKDWDMVDKILGGTDLDERKLDDAKDVVLSEGRVVTFTVSGHALKDLSDELRSIEGQPPSDEEPTRWSWKLVGPRNEVLYTARTEEGKPAIYNSEEEADEAGADRCDDLSIDDDLLNEEEMEEVEQLALSMLAEEYSKHVKDPADIFEDMTDTFYELKDDLVAAVNDIIANKGEAPEAPPAEPASPAPPADYSPKAGKDDWRQESEASDYIKSLIG
jgi:hypothetical protein